MKKTVLSLSILVMFSGCTEDTRQRVMFANCIRGADTPAYAEAIKACADAAIKLRDEAIDKKEPQDGR